MEYEAVIGMEVHVQMNTRSKVFCGCSTNFHAPPNTNVCPVCLGMPGAMPVLNREMVTKSTMAGLALNCTISRWSKQDRKNYFYPDQSKNYQISQYDLPLCHDGNLEIEVNGVKKDIGITRAHMEEDTARNTHTIGGGQSGVDFNRAGMPLLEIVTEPDISSSDEAFAYLTSLKQILAYLNVSDCNMEEGSLRAEANISVRPKGQKEFGTKTEVKNVASFSGTAKAIEYEIKRQIKVLNDGGEIIQETRGWDADKNRTFSQRQKESAHDYRYFPEPDLVPVVMDDAWEQSLKDSLPELPAARRARLEESTGLSPYDVQVLTATRDMADYFETVIDQGADAKQAANWIMGDLQKLLSAADQDITDAKVSATDLADLLALIEDDTISGKIAKEVLEAMFETGDAPKKIVEDKGLVQITDTGTIDAVVHEILSNNPTQVEQYKGGNEKVIGFFVGQVMKATQGKANPKIVNEALRAALNA